MRDTLRRSALAACSCFLDTFYQYQATSTGAEEMLSISLVLQKGSRANLQPSKAAPSSRYVSREVAGELDEVINAIEMPSQSERPEQSDPPQSEAVDQTAGAKAPGSSEPEVHYPSYILLASVHAPGLVVVLSTISEKRTVLVLANGLILYSLM